MKSLTLLLVFLAFIQCTESKTESSEESASVTEVKATSQQESMLINSDDFAMKMNNENTVILDVRTPGEVAQGIIEGAMVIDFSNSEFRSSLENLDKNKTYLVYCASGGRSHNTQELMNTLGFTKVYDLQGGIRAWKSSGKELVLPVN